MQPINYAGPNAQISHIFIKVIKLPIADDLAKLGQSL
jgi:hypothetical protein